MSDIFISHASADQALADIFVQFLKEAIGVPATTIFCSSVSGHGIPLSADFNDYMKDQIQEPKLVILLMTEQYMESAFCLMELGAAWAKSHQTLPIIVSPVPFSTVTKTLGLKQAWDIDDKDGLIGLRDLIKASGIALEHRTDHDWDKKRTQWAADQKRIRKTLRGATKVAAEEHARVKAEAAEKANEISNLEELLGEAQEKIAALEKLKDAEGVKAVKRAFSTPDPEEEFGARLNAIRHARPNVANEVLRFMILNYYGKTTNIKWADGDTKDSFADAIDRKVISDVTSAPLWDSPKLGPLKSALDDLKTFLEEQGGYEYLGTIKPPVPTDLDDIEFWEKNLHLY